MSQLQARLITKDERYKVPDVPLDVPTETAPNDLDALVNRLLLGVQDSADAKDEVDGRNRVEFDFLVKGELLRTSLGRHVEQTGMPTESVIEIEFIVKCAPPEPAFNIPHKDWVSAVQCFQDWILTGCYDGIARLWDHSGSTIADFPGHQGPIKDLTLISCDSDSLTFVTASQDEQLRLWQHDFHSGSTDCIHVYKGHVQSVETVATDTASRRFCSGSWDGTMKIWSSVADTTNDMTSVETSAPKRMKTSRKKKAAVVTSEKAPLLTLSGHGQTVSSIVWLSDEAVCSAGWDHCIRVWDIHSGINTSTLTGTCAFNCIAVSPYHGLLASGGSDRHVRLWDVRGLDGKTMVKSLSSHTGWVSCLVWSKTSENELVSGSYDRTLRLWDIRSCKVPLYAMTSHEAKVLCLDWSHSQIASGGADNQLHIHRAVR